jgi:hypothetical protein
MVKPDPKGLSWKCLFGEINFFPDHELFLMSTKISFLMANIGSSN